MAEYKMVTSLNTSIGKKSFVETQKKGLVPEGFFKINPSIGKCVFTLKGVFNESNISLICKVMIMSFSFQERSMELEMSEVETINMKAMARLIIALKELEEQGINTAVKGLNEKKRRLAYELGMNYITQIG